MSARQRRFRWFSLALALGACATANTPQQDLAYERWARCVSPYVTLQWVSPDGQIGFMVGNPADVRDVSQCLTEASRTGPSLPPPVAVRPPGGP